MCFQNGFSVDMNSPSPAKLFSVCSHAVFNVMTTEGCVHNFSRGVNGLNLDHYQTKNAGSFFAVWGTKRFSSSLGMIGCVAKGGKLRRKLSFRKLYEAALNQAETVAFKAAFYKLGTNCVAFTIHMADFCDMFV